MIGTIRFRLLLAAFLAAAGPVPLAAGEGQELGEMFSPVIRPYHLGASARAEYEPEVDAGYGAHYQRTTLRANARTQLWRAEQHALELSLSAVEALNRTDAVVPGGGPVPDRLYDLRGNLSWRHPADGGWLWGASAGVVSATDRPCHDRGVIGLSAMASVLVPGGEHDSWLLSLNYSNDRARYNNIPLPWVTWIWRDRPLMPTFIAMAGFPFAMVAWNPDPRFGMDVAASIFGDVRLGLQGQPLAGVAWLRLRVAYDETSESYRRDDRLEDEDRLFFRARRLTLGVTLGAKGNAIDLFGGRLFQRQAFEGHSIGDDGQRLSLEDGWLVGAGARIFF